MYSVTMMPPQSLSSTSSLRCPCCMDSARMRWRGPPAAPSWTWAMLVIAALLLRAPSVACTAADDDDADQDGGLLAMLGSLVRATSSRLSALSALLMGSQDDADAAAEDADDADEADDRLGGAAALLAASPQRVRYHGYQLVRVQLRSRKQAGQLRQLVEQQQGAQLWQHARRNRTADVLLPPAVAPVLKDSLDDWGLHYSVLSADVQKIIAFQNPPRLKSQRRTSTLRSGHPYTWKRYHRYEDIVAYMHFLASAYPHLAHVIPIGSSTEGRPLYVLRLSSHEQRDDEPQPRNVSEPSSRQGRGRSHKPAIWIDAGTHGREWVGPAVALYLCMQLVERHDSHPQLLRDADWYVLPVLNPDGYEFSHTTDRLWRKTRSMHELPAGRLFKRPPCAGVDLNRNWDFNWGDRAGASDEPCSDMYAGPRAFSEPEARAAAAFMLRRQERLQLYLSLHSYSQLWLIPESSSYKRLPDYQEMYNKALLAVRALRRVRNTKYQIGTASDMLYTISGCADNWAKNVAGIKYAYTVELPDRGRYGFLLPASMIVPTGKETFAAVKALAQAIVCKRPA